MPAGCFHERAGYIRLVSERIGHASGGIMARSDVNELYESDARFLANKRRFIQIAVWLGVVVALSAGAVQYLCGDGWVALQSLWFPATAPLLLWYMYRSESAYRRSLLLFASIVLVGVAANAFLALHDPASLIWYGVYPIAFFFLLGPRLGLLWAAFGLLSLTVAYPFFYPLHGRYPVAPGVFLLGIMAYLVSMLISGYYAKILNDFQRQLYQRANHDALTGAFSRLRGMEILANHTSRDQRVDPAPLALILFDLDDFKQVNDQYGHDVGDQILRTVSQGVVRSMRSGDRLIRWGGEEFLLLLPSTRPADAVEVAEQLRALIPELTSGILPSPQTASIGVTDYRPGETVESLLHRVDQLMYGTKRSGKDGITQDFAPPASSDSQPLSAVDMV